MLTANNPAESMQKPIGIIVQTLNGREQYGSVTLSIKRAKTAKR